MHSTVQNIYKGFDLFKESLRKKGLWARSARQVRPIPTERIQKTKVDDGKRKAFVFVRKGDSHDPSGDLYNYYNHMPQGPVVLFVRASSVSIFKESKNRV